MVKIVESGCRDCTVTLDGTECAVEFPANYRVFSVQNMSDGDIIMSVESGKTAADDGVRIVEAGGVGALNHMRSDINTLYITGTGKVQISAGNEAVLPFRLAAKGGDTVSACGNPVQLSGLQGGVPFAEISVCGENIIGQDLSLSVSGKNFLKNSDFTDPLNSNGQTEYSTNDTTSGAYFTIDSWYSWLVLGKKIIVGENCITIIRDNSLTTSKTDIRQRLDVFLPFLRDQEITVSVNYEKLSDDARSQMFVRANTEGGSPYNLFLTDLSKSGYTEKTVKIPSNATYLEFGIWTNDSLDIYNAQIEIGRSATKFEAYRDMVSYSITPDSNPYTIPNDIRQQDSLNNISVSAGELSVVGVKENLALKKVWDKLDELATAIIVSNGEI